MSTTQQPRVLNIIKNHSAKEAARPLFDAIFFDPNYTLPEGVKSQRADFIKRAVNELDIKLNTATAYFTQLMAEADGTAEAKAQAAKERKAARAAAKAEEEAKAASEAEEPVAAE